MTYVLLPFLIVVTVFALLCAAAVLIAAAELARNGVAERAPLPLAQAVLTVAVAFAIAFAPDSLSIPAVVAGALWALLLPRPARHAAGLGLVGLASLQLPARPSSLVLLAGVGAAFAVEALWHRWRGRRAERIRHRAWRPVHA
jgi:hypothetical protein